MNRKALSLIATLFVAALMFGVQIKSQAQALFGVSADFGTATNGFFLQGEGYYTSGLADGWLQAAGINWDFANDGVVSLTFTPSLLDPLGGSVKEIFTGQYDSFDANGNWLGSTELYAIVKIKYTLGIASVNIVFDDDIDNGPDTSKDKDPWYNSNAFLLQLDGAITVLFH